jgi:Flp pilus assembly protein TadD
VAIRPTDVKAWQNLGVAECWRGNLMQGVVASRRALKLEPRHIPAANNLALAFLEMGELDAACKVVRDALQHDPRSRILRRLRIRLALKRVGRRSAAVLRHVLRRRDD